MKSYFRYAPSGRLGVICSPEGPSIFDNTGKVVFTTSVESVGIWNVRQASHVGNLNYEDPRYPYSDRSEVTTLSVTDDQTTVCVGYSTGEVRMFNYVDKSIISTLRGHRSAVSALVLKPPSNDILVTGSADCTIVLWDLVSRNGIARLQGHKDMITALGFVNNNSNADSLLVSASKDTLLKVWDLVAMTCLQTVVGHRSEVWSLAFLSGDEGKSMQVFTGASDDLVRVYKVSTEDINGASSENSEVLQYYGCFKRSTSERCITLALNPSKSILAVQSAGKTVDVFRLLDSQQSKRRWKRRIKRLSEKGDDDAGEQSSPQLLEDQIEFLQTLKVGTKIRSFAFNPHPPTADEDVALVSLVNNSLEMYRFQTKNATAGSPIASKSSIIDIQGHRSDVRGLCVSGDDGILATCSAESIKIWSTRSGQCVGTCKFDDYALCLAFAPGGRFLIVGTKSGTLALVDVASGETVQAVEDAHEGAVWSVCIRPDGLGFITASADKCIKLWSFELGSQGSMRFQCERQLLTPSDALCVRMSHSKSLSDSLFAVAQLDHNIRVFFQDSLKLYLTLYGHKLPVLSIDISSDNTLLVSGSADKTIKIWGLDFGDCHKSLFAHDDSVTCVRFVNKTHFFFSGGKDGSVKYWDADRFEQILYLPGHKGSIWSLEVASDGSSVFSTGADRSVRMWSRLEEIVFAEEERERMLEAQVDDAAAQNQIALSDGQTNAAIATLESIQSGDNLMSCIDTIEQELPGVFTELLSLTRDHYADATASLHKNSKSAIMLSLSPLRYFLRSLRLIKAPDLEPTLLALPFHYVQRILVLLVQLAQIGLEVELSCRCAIFLLVCHQNQVAASSSLAPFVVNLRDAIANSLASYRFMVGTNMAGLGFLNNQLSASSQDIEAHKTLKQSDSSSSSTQLRKRKATSS